jgi:hypothetical protein
VLPLRCVTPSMTVGGGTHYTLALCSAVHTGLCSWRTQHACSSPVAAALVAEPPFCEGTVGHCTTQTRGRVAATKAIGSEPRIPGGIVCRRAEGSCSSTTLCRQRAVVAVVEGLGLDAAPAGHFVNLYTNHMWLVSAQSSTQGRQACSAHSMAQACAAATCDKAAGSHNNVPLSGRHPAQPQKIGSSALPATGIPLTGSGGRQVAQADASETHDGAPPTLHTILSPEQVQAPFTHVKPGMHLLLHAPQCVVLESVFCPEQAETSVGDKSGHSPQLA